MKVRSRSLFTVSLTLSLLQYELVALSSRALSPRDYYNNGNDAMVARTTSTMSSSSRGACQATADANSSNNNNDNNRQSINSRGMKRKSPGAPLVDSSLLRYISKQKQTQFFTNNQCNELIINSNLDNKKTSNIANENNVDNNNNNSPYYIKGINSAFPIPPSNDTTTVVSLSTNAIKQQITTGTAAVATAASTSTSPSPSTTTTTATATTLPSSTSLVDEDVSQWRMTQYNRHTIAQKLIALGGDEEEANVAGHVVQRYYLVRTARRRIRTFLKERDSLWKNGSLLSPTMLDNMVDTASRGDTVVSSLNAEVSTTTTTTMASPTYSLDDTLQVMQDYDLSGKDICAILSHTPSLALMMPRKSFLNQDGNTKSKRKQRNSTKTVETLEDAIERTFHGLLLQTLGLRKYDARKVIRTCPGLLTVRGSKSAEQVMTMMLKLGISEISIARDKMSIPISAGLFRLIAFLCSSSIRMPIDQVGPLLRRKQSRELMDAVIPLLTSTSFAFRSKSKYNDQSLIDTDKGLLQDADNNDDDDDDGIGVNDDDDPIVEAAWWSKSREERKRRVEDIYRNMTRTANILRTEIGTEDLSRVISAYPNVLLLDVDNQILPVARYLMDDLGIIPDDVGKVLQLFPMLLGMDIVEMEMVVEYLLSLGVKKEDMSSIFRAFPALLTMKPPDMEPVVDYLRSIGVEDIGDFVTRLPPVLGYSVEKDLRPKWEFLTVVCMFASFEIIKFPAYFSYPLDRVIRSRYEYLSYKGISRQLIPVDSVLRYGDKDFATKVARDDDKGEAFRIFCQNRSVTTKSRRRKENNNNNNSTTQPRMKNGRTMNQTSTRRRQVSEDSNKTV